MLFQAGCDLCEGSRLRGEHATSHGAPGAENPPSDPSGISRDPGNRIVVVSTPRRIATVVGQLQHQTEVATKARQNVTQTNQAMIDGVWQILHLELAITMGSSSL